MAWSFSKIAPIVNEEPNKLSIVPIKPMFGDWLVVGIVTGVGVYISSITTPDFQSFLLCTTLFLAMAYSFIDDTYLLVLDKDKDQVTVEKTKLGTIYWRRVAPLSELVDAEIVQVEGRNSVSYKIELEFLSSHGYYRLPVSETTVIGQENKKELNKLIALIQKFMDLKPVPDWMKEENLRKGFGEEKDEIEMPLRRSPRRKQKKS